MLRNLEIKLVHSNTDVVRYSVKMTVYNLTEMYTFIQ
jgi:hypothetical protein